MSDQTRAMSMKKNVNDKTTTIVSVAEHVS